MKVTKQELIDSFSAIIGDNNSDESIAFLENLSDSIDDDLQTSYDNLKADYDKLDADWRDRYIKRFSNVDVDPEVSEVIEQTQEDTENNTDVVDEAEGVSLDDAMSIF